jgi:hypothetical protein
MEFERSLRAVSLLSRLPKTEPRSSFTADVLRRVSQLRQARREAKRKWTPRISVTLVVAAAACVTVGWNEWMLPTLVSRAGDGLLILVNNSSLLGSLFTLVGASAALLRSFAETMLVLVRSNANYVISVYMLTLAIILVSVFVAKTNRRLSDASVFCV